MEDVVIFAIWCICPFAIAYTYRIRAAIGYLLWVRYIVKWYFTRNIGSEYEVLDRMGLWLRWSFSFPWYFQPKYRDWMIFLDWFSVSVPVHDQFWPIDVQLPEIDKYEYRLYTAWWKAYILRRYSK